MLCCLRSDELFTVQGLGVEIDNSKCQEDGKDAEANEKVALDGALATLVGYTTLVTADVMFLVVFLIGHCYWGGLFTVYRLRFFDLCLVCQGTGS